MGAPDNPRSKTPLEGVLGLSRKSKIQDPPLAQRKPVTASVTALQERKSLEKWAYLADVTENNEDWVSKELFLAKRRCFQRILGAYVAPL